MSTYPPPVPKPSNAGTSKTALVVPRGSYVNLRNGPGTNYQDVGDIQRNTLVAYYPATRRSDGWIWVEQYGVGGWIFTGVVDLQDVPAPVPTTPDRATPFDNKLGIWHWKGDAVAESTIDDLARNLKAAAPGLNQVWVKTSDITSSSGAQWQGFWDTKRGLAIDGPTSIDRWVSGLSRHGLEFVAWAIPRGMNIAAEADLIIQACQRPGVKAMVLDVEPYEGFWVGGAQAVRPLMTRIRRALPGSFHIGICVDPRRQWFTKINPEEWFPFVNSVHPMVYWATFRRTPEDSLAETYQVWGNYGRPIVPILQGDADAGEITEAGTLSANRHGALGLSFWRLGVMNSAQLRAASNALGSRPDVDPSVPTIIYGETQMVRPSDSGFTSFSYTGQNELQSFAGTWGWTVYFKATETTTSKVAARWTPTFKQSGKYAVEVFVPARHATTKNARYKIHGVKNSSTEILVSIDQSKERNTWVSLGVFDFDKDAINAGTVFLNDLTGERDLAIAFDAVRWRQILDTAIGGGNGSVPAFAGDGYDAPIGTESERRATKVWPGSWLDASPFGRLYFVGTPSEAYHTGADLNLPQDADRGKPVYATASGEVVFASRLPTWGNVIIIKHDPLATNGKVMYSRSAHVDTMLVSVGERVERGHQIATVGNAFGRWAYHLHFDLSPTTILESNPEHWPGKDRDSIFLHYVDPKEFILANRPRS
ncbi:MAG: peptidoglycan DD-metalloendopeptidase family protein [Anaerolineae bacterium]|nr:peptidoglycan DD-metalloendopeptidase family protein [Anaerolineae bacterium]